MSKITNLFLAFFIYQSVATAAQIPVTRSIKSFGAKGDGTTNDTGAFLQAANFFTARGGNGTLTIPAGIYIVGQQIASKGDLTKHAYAAVDILGFKNISNLVIQGQQGSVLRYVANLKFGSFDPVTGKVFNGNNPAVPAIKYAAIIGNCISLIDCRNITIKNLQLDGNNKAMKFGGRYDDQGIQLTHNGVFIQNCHAIVIDHINASYFGLDGIIVSNIASSEPDNITISNAVFEFNCRQGLSWVGGNFLTVKNCQFNHTGKSAYFSPPGAGVDLEAEINSISGGIFDNCQFVDNSGCGVVTAGKTVQNCRFTNCTFWGTTSWSIWVSAPSFTFTGCKIYGSIVHGYAAPSDAVATHFIRCLFEDKPYNGQPPYGKFMIESEGAWRISFDSCTIINNDKPIAWLNNNGNPEGKATISNSHFIINKKDSGIMSVALFNVNFKMNTVEFKDANAKKRAYWAAPCCITPAERDATKVIYNTQ